MAITAKFSFLIAAIAFAVAFCCVAAVGGDAVQTDLPDSGDAGSLSFASELWKSEYLNSDGAAGAAQSLAGGSQFVAPGVVPPGTVPAISADTQSGALTEPHAQQLLVTTAIDSVNQTAAFSTDDEPTDAEGEPAGRQFTPLNAWQVAQARASGTPVRTADNPGGPTLTVYLVGLVALIVLGGTVLSGRG